MNSKGVSWIVQNLKHDTKEYLDGLIEDGSLEWEECHQPFEYPAEVNNQKCWPHLGIFYEYLIRRQICVLQEVKASDKLAEMYKSLLNFYDQEIAEGAHTQSVYTDEGEIHISVGYMNVGKVRKFLNSYKYFKDANKYKSTNILEHIFNTSMLHMLSHGSPTIPYNPEFINLSNVQAVLKHITTWNVEKVEISTTVRGKYFLGVADLVFDDCIMDVKVSKYDNPNENWSTFKQGFRQMIFYALGLFIEKKREIKTFEVYNPLRGVVHVLNLPNLDFGKLRHKVDSKPCWKD